MPSDQSTLCANRQSAQEVDEHPVWQPGTLATSEADFHTICSNHGIPRDQYSTASGFHEDDLGV
jgi:hypothetical protein